MPIPKCYIAHDLQELLAQSIDFPVVLKPSFKKNYYEKTKLKGILVNDRQQLEREYTKMNTLIPESQIVVQEFLSGGPENLFSFAALFDGQEILQGMSVRRLRQHPMDFGHATTYAEACELPELRRFAELFLRASHYRGVAEIEFMFDPRTQEYKFIEMNGRFWGWHGLTFRAGLNLPQDLFRMLLGYTVAPVQPDLQATWTRLITDIPTIAQQTWRGGVSTWACCRQLLARPMDAVWSWRDPLPFIHEVAIAPYLWLKKGF